MRWPTHEEDSPMLLCLLSMIVRARFDRRPEAGQEKNKISRSFRSIKSPIVRRGERDGEMRGKRHLDNYFHRPPGTLTFLRIIVRHFELIRTTVYFLVSSSRYNEHRLFSPRTEVFRWMPRSHQGIAFLPSSRLWYEREGARRDRRRARKKRRVVSP